VKRYIVDGAKAKALRQNLERLATQKELAYAAGLSERQLRKIENGNISVRADDCRRLAEALGVDVAAIVFSTDGPRLVAPATAAPLDWPRGPTLIPRFDTDIATFTQDENKLFEMAGSNSEIVAEYAVKLDAETSTYAEELLALLEQVSANRWSKTITNVEGLRLRRRIRELVVLLKGNDVWIYVTSHLKKLPESHVVLEGAPSNYRSQLIVAFGPPGEYGEVSIKVAIDHGQPWICDFDAIPF
jgi:transcriptional regulator with XRE-family HTH domain